MMQFLKPAFLNNDFKIIMIANNRHGVLYGFKNTFM